MNNTIKALIPILLLGGGEIVNGKLFTHRSSK